MKRPLLLALCLWASVAAAQDSNGLARSSLPIPDGVASHSTKPASGQVAGYPPQAGEGGKDSLREFRIRPFVRGSQQAILSAHQGKPFILALWSLDCTHCRADLALLGEVAKKYRGLDLVLVSTDASEQKLAIAQTLRHHRLGSAESWAFADSFAERLRYEIDPQWYGELPRTYFFGAQGQATAISGRLERAQVERWLRKNGLGG